jgi:hypothetical protein
MTSDSGMCTGTAECARDPLPTLAHAERDPLLGQLAEVRRRKDTADRDMRVLLAFAREITAPRPYRLADLAHAAGMYISGIRAVYSPGDVQHAARLLDGTPLRHLQAAITTLLAEGQHAAACEPHTAA